MKPAPFAHHAPASLHDAVGLLARFADDAKVLAGGQSLIPVLAMRLSRFDHLVDLHGVGELTGIDRTGDTLRIGAMTTQTTVAGSAEVSAAAPLLARATRLVGHAQIRNRGTLGGSLAHADPAAEYPAVALALDAELAAVGPDGGRRIPAAEFFASTWTTTLEPSEVLVGAEFPAWGPGSGFAAREAGRRHGDFAMAGAMCGVRVVEGRVDRAAVALFGVGSTPVRATAVERALVGTAAADLGDLDELGALAVRDLDPPDDLHASGPQRRRMAAALTVRALREALAEAMGEFR
jgi:aerobic carbon-monoxide dehydrogenase medium subunit